MTRACLLWAVLMATLGSALCVTRNAPAQICSDYYRFGPLYSNLSPFADGCMEAYEEEQASVRQPMCTEDSESRIDLSGRSVVAVLDDPSGVPAAGSAASSEDDSTGSADFAAESVAQSDPHCPAASQDASETTESRNPHYRAYEDYYGYDYYRHGGPHYVAPQSTETDNRTEPAREVSVQNSLNEYYLKYGCRRSLDSHDAPSTVQEVPAVEDEPAVQDEPAVDHVEAPSYVRPYAAYPYEAYKYKAYQYQSHNHAGSDCTAYEATCRGADRADEPAATPLAGEQAVESTELGVEREFDYENAPYGYYLGCEDQHAADAVADHDSSETESVELASPPVASAPVCPDEADDSYWHRYRSAYYQEHLSRQQELQASGTGGVVAPEVDSQAPSAAVAKKQADDYEAYDAYRYGYGYGYDHGCYERSLSCPDEPTADVSADASSGLASQSDESLEISPRTAEYEGYEAYRYGYYQGRYGETPNGQGENSTASSSDSHLASPGDESSVATQQQAEESCHAYDYHYGYGYEYAYENACQDTPEAAVTPQAPVQEPVTPATPDYDMYQRYEYDYYKPYDETPAEQGSMAQEPTPQSLATDPYDSYDVYDYDNQSMQSPVQAEAEATESSSSDERTSQARTTEGMDAEDTDSEHSDQQYYGRYPYGYGHGYDFEYQKQYGSHGEATESVDESADESVSESVDECGEDVTTDVDVDLQQSVDWGRRSLDSMADSRLIDVLRTAIGDMRESLTAMAGRVDLQQCQSKLGDALLAMIQQPVEAVVEPLDANVFLFEFEAGYTACMEMAIALEETPWVIEDPLTGQIQEGEIAPVMVEPANDLPVSVLPSFDRATLLQWTGYAVERAKTAWASLSPQLERLAAESVARIPVVEEPSTEQR